MYTIFATKKQDIVLIGLFQMSETPYSSHFLLLKYPAGIQYLARPDTM